MKIRDKLIVDIENSRHEVNPFSPCNTIYTDGGVQRALEDSMYWKNDYGWHSEKLWIRPLEKDAKKLVKMLLEKYDIREK